MITICYFKDTVMNVLLSQLPKDIIRDRLTTDVLLSAYVNKLIKINNENDKWSLISLSNNQGNHYSEDSSIFCISM